MWKCPSLATGFTPQHAGPIDLYQPDMIISTDLFLPQNLIVCPNQCEGHLTWVQILGVSKTSFTIFGNVTFKRCSTSLLSITCKREIKCVS